MLVAAVLRPEEREDGELEMVGLAPHQRDDAGELPVREAELTMERLFRDRAQDASLARRRTTTQVASRGWAAATSRSCSPSPRSGARRSSSSSSVSTRSSPPSSSWDGSSSACSCCSRSSLAAGRDPRPARDVGPVRRARCAQQRGAVLAPRVRGDADRLGAGGGDPGGRADPDRRARDTHRPVPARPRPAGSSASRSAFSASRSSSACRREASSSARSPCSAPPRATRSPSSTQAAPSGRSRRSR